MNEFIKEHFMYLELQDNFEKDCIWSTLECFDYMDSIIQRYKRDNDIEKTRDQAHLMWPIFKVMYVHYNNSNFTAREREVLEEFMAIYKESGFWAKHKNYYELSKKG